MKRLAARTPILIRQFNERRVVSVSQVKSQIQLQFLHQEVSSLFGNLMGYFVNLNTNVNTMFAAREVIYAKS